MELIIAILIPIIAVVIATLVVVVTDMKHKGKARQGCCGGKNVETEDAPNQEDEDEVVFGEIRYPEEKPPGVSVITLHNPLYAKSPKEQSCSATVEQDKPDLPPRAGILHDQLYNIAEVDNTRISDDGSSDDQIFNSISNSEESQSNSTTTNTTNREQLSSTASNIMETCFTAQTVASDSDTTHSCKSSLHDSQSNSSSGSITDGQLVPIVPNPAYNFKETYLAAQRVTLELNPAYNYKSSYTSGL